MNSPQNEPTVTMFNEHQLADRWNMSVRTLQDWRHKKTGPKYIKFKGWSVRYPVLSHSVHTVIKNSFQG